MTGFDMNIFWAAAVGGLVGATIGSIVMFLYFGVIQLGPNNDNSGGGLIG